MASLGRPKKYETVTTDEVDWSFAADPEVLAMIRQRAEGAASKHRVLDADDVEQELMLYLASRPEKQGAFEQMDRACSRYTMSLAQRRYQQVDREVPLDLDDRYWQE